MRRLTEKEVRVFKFLNDLRDEGVVNMFGAAPYILRVEDESMSLGEARRILSLWMENFQEDKRIYDQIEILEN